jgi:hypothetical protein
MKFLTEIFQISAVEVLEIESKHISEMPLGFSVWIGQLWIRRESDLVKRENGASNYQSF